jgi:hypothetical protein
MYSTAMEVIRERQGDVPIRLCKETVALHRRLGSAQDTCCYCEFSPQIRQDRGGEGRLGKDRDEEFPALG